MIDETFEYRVVRFRHEEGHTRMETALRFDISEGEVERLLWAYEPEVFPQIRLDPVAEEVVAAREGGLPKSRLIPGEHDQLRWERIARRAGTSVPEARRLYESARGEGSARRSYTGRGRRSRDMDSTDAAMSTKSVPKQWIVDTEERLRHVKRRCARERADEIGGNVVELSGSALEEHRAHFGESPSARCARPGCWGERERAQAKPPVREPGIREDAPR